MRKLVSLFLVSIFALGLIGCTKYASQEELQQLNNLKSEVSQLEKEIKSKEQEKAKLQKEIADRDAKIKKLQEEKEKVQKRLQNQ